VLQGAIVGMVNIQAITFLFFADAQSAYNSVLGLGSSQFQRTSYRGKRCFSSAGEW
jgi:hypothetical protein